MDSFIVGLWARVFGALGWLSPFQLVRALVPRVRLSYVFVDFWVLGQLILAVVSLAVSSPGAIRGWEWALLVYGATRVFEIVVYQVNVLLFDEYRTLKCGGHYAVRGYRRLVVLAVHNYVEVVVWFAFAYRNFSYLFGSQKMQLDCLTGSLYFAIVTVATLGYGDITPTDPRGAWIVMGQSAVGLFMTLMVLARFIGILRRPATLDPLEPGAD
jgi:hypothetical protein